MIGIAFRQLRATIVGTVALTVALVAALLVHAGMARAVGSRLAQACGTAGDAACRSLQAELWDMHLAVAPYLGNLTVTIVLIAVLWGAPLISREVESGTAALAWSQSITRRRWLVSRLAVSITALGICGLALGFAVTWWLASFTAAPQSGGEMILDAIDLHGPLLPALWIAGLLVGVLIGAVIPRVLPAMAVTGVVALLGAIGFNLTGRLSTARPVGESQVLAAQVLHALPVLGVAALAALLVFRRIGQLSV